MDWSEFYASQAGRDARPTLLRATKLRNAPPGHAIDLGCGEGSDTRFLLRGGWQVLAIDGSEGVEQRVRFGVDASFLPALTVQRSDFGDLNALPVADLVYAGFSLPFCRPDAFPILWSAIGSSVSSSGFFAGELFGPHDSWADRKDMNFHSRHAVDELFAGFEVLDLVEEDEDGLSIIGPKHWHVFHIVARKC
ncbi:MAG: methyltransferase domain-containing protein [Terrimesophilobacter sp.]